MIMRSDCFLAPEPVMNAFNAMVSKFQVYAPEWKGAITPEESIKQVLAVIEKASIENGNAGEALSHLGNKRWL